MPVLAAKASFTTSRALSSPSLSRLSSSSPSAAALPLAGTMGARPVFSIGATPVAAIIIPAPITTEPSIPAISTKRRCLRCDIWFDSALELETHIRSLHLHKCAICENIFPTAEKLQAHVSHQQAKKCRYCESSCVFGVFLPSHIRRVHADILAAGKGIVAGQSITPNNGMSTLPTLNLDVQDMRTENARSSIISAPTLPSPALSRIMDCEPPALQR
ncbi:hypothetical protein DFS34DRAFT_399614 [Phlyctochytrium arcticum]|nr:hypothetical protein DFS34DRAFT_399614 [Phlyctochytrium arcticum]